ncbi:MAG: 2-isopropylmalate synthase [Anaerovoracaceae bacterium]
MTPDMQKSNKYSIGYFMPPTPEYDWVRRDHLTTAPQWCSVDLRDGNQALIVPMTLEEKLEFFQYLVQIGFKEIEVGFPAASDTEYALLRTLIERDMIPDDVRVQVLTQSREHIISKTFEALRGVKKAVVHLYNSTSVAQREQVFHKDKKAIKQIAIDGARLIKRYAAQQAEETGTDFRFEYSPESFTGTEPEYATEVCNAVIDMWEPTPEKKVIINLPSTVQMSMPHVYASQIEYVSKNLHCRDSVIISLHPHNDRGTGVADAELGLLAGGQRIEGTLFGNGERTGNVDIVTLALNMYTHGVEPGLDFTDMPAAVRNYERFTGMRVPPRQPYGGKLVFAAFSGSHQDAIAKGMKYRDEHLAAGDPGRWTVPYLPIDPHDLGREYEADVIRINSQSGKGGVAYILEHNFGYSIPPKMREEIGYLVKGVSDHEHKELAPDEIFTLFDNEYINVFDPIDITDATFKRLSDYKGDSDIHVSIDVDIEDNTYHLEGTGNGRLDAVRNALRQAPYQFNYDFVTYSEHALESESDSRAAAYVAISDANGWVYWGVGLHDDIIYASVNALVSAINRMNQIRHFIN